MCGGVQMPWRGIVEALGAMLQGARLRVCVRV